jgi:hypothetical protein
MKIKGSFRPILILILLVAAAAVLYFAAEKFDIHIANPFYKKEEIRSSSTLLKQIENLSRLNSIEFIYKTVFPYDLIEPDSDFKRIIEEYKSGKKLDFKEVELLSVYGISAEAGIDLLNDDYSFAVITARIKAGFNFPDTIPEDSITINREDDSIIVRMPPVQITEVIIEDADSSVYKYPDLNISPEQWKTLTSMISRLVREEAVKKGILQQAEKRGKNLIRELLLSAGFNQVSFDE